MKKYIDNFMQYKFLLSQLVMKGIKLKYRRSVLGVFWSLLEPLLNMIVLTIVFGTLFEQREKSFAVYVLTGRLLYSFFSQATKASLKSIRSNAAMIRKVYVPKYLYPLAATLHNYATFLPSLLVLVVVALVRGVYPTVYLLQVVYPLILLLVMTYGIGMILATVGVFFRDIEYLWSVALTLIMYACAIFYPVAKIEASGFYWILKFNPLYAVINMFRSAVFGEWMNAWYVGYATVFSVVVLIVGLVVFKKNQDRFILSL